MNAEASSPVHSALKHFARNLFDNPTLSVEQVGIGRYLVHSRPTLSVTASCSRFEFTRGKHHGAYLPTLKAAYEDLCKVEEFEAVMSA